MIHVYHEASMMPIIDGTHLTVNGDDKDIRKPCKEFEQAVDDFNADNGSHALYVHSKEYDYYFVAIVGDNFDDALDELTEKLYAFMKSRGVYFR